MFNFSSSKPIDFFSCFVDIYINNHSVLVPRLFSVLYMIFQWNFVKIFLAYGQKYPVEISAETGVIDHAKSEYVIFIIREPTHQNSYTVIWKALSYFLLSNLFIKIFVRHLGIPLQDNYRSLFSFLCSFHRCDFYGLCKKKIFF